MAQSVAHFNAQLSEGHAISADRRGALGIDRTVARHSRGLGPDLRRARHCRVGIPRLSRVPSQGSHFFQNLTAFQIGYFTVNPDAGEGFVDWQWLAAQPAVADRLRPPLAVRSPLVARAQINSDGMMKSIPAAYCLSAVCRRQRRTVIHLHPPAAPEAILFRGLPKLRRVPQTIVAITGSCSSPPFGLGGIAATSISNGRFAGVAWLWRVGVRQGNAGDDPLRRRPRSMRSIPRGGAS